MTDAPAVGTLAVELVSPEAILFKGHARSVQVPAYDGLVGILPRHAPMMALLGKGILTLHASGGGTQRFSVGGGFVQVGSNVVRVVAEEASAIDGKAVSS